FSLRRPIGGHEPRLADFLPGGGGAQAGGLEVRPGLLGAIAADRADIEPVALGQRLRDTGFNLWGKTGQNGEGSSNAGSHCDCRNSFDHDGPLSQALGGPVISLGSSLTMSRFGMPSPKP